MDLRISLRLGVGFWRRLRVVRLAALGLFGVAALKVANRLTSGVVATIFPDSGDKYLSERFWDEGN
jgi:hypothetical protein